MCIVSSISAWGTAWKYAKKVFLYFGDKNEKRFRILRACTSFHRGFPSVPPNAMSNSIMDFFWFLLYISYWGLYLYIYYAFWCYSNVLSKSLSNTEYRKLYDFMIFFNDIFTTYESSTPDTNMNYKTTFLKWMIER